MSSRDGSSSSGTENQAEDAKPKHENEVPACISGKRPNYISWEDYFMGVAYLAAQRSKDPVTQVGSCIVDDEYKIVGVGYNGMPRGCDDDKFPWLKTDDFLKNKLTYVCHAEMNAFMNANPKDTKGCKLYVTLFPCNECAKIIIQAGIKEVIYGTQRLNKKTRAAIIMFDAVNIEHRPFKPKKRRIVIEFEGSLAESDPLICSPVKKERKDEV